MDDAGNSGLDEDQHQSGEEEPQREGKEDESTNISEAKDSSIPSPTEENGKVEEDLDPEEMTLWTTVQENSSDFTTWTQLLQKVEQKGKVVPLCKVYDAFLYRYPYCYGYWKKYSDFQQKMSGNVRAQEVFERGIAAIPLSVDLWLHYINFAGLVHSQQEEFQTIMRSLYDRAISSCGLDYRSDKLWTSYIDWEKRSGTLQHAVGVYDRLIATPTQQYQQNFDNFRTQLESSPPSALLSSADYQQLMEEIVPAGSSLEGQDELNALMKSKLIEQRQAVFRANVVEVQKRAAFEEGIKRPYFHVKPLERAQLRNWLEYLDFEIGQGSLRRIIVLFERCMIACCMYEDFWLKFVRYVEENHTSEYVRSVYSRACQMHLPHKPNMHLAWAAYEEKQGNVSGARGILKTFDCKVSGHVLLRLRRIGLEVRHKNHQLAEALLAESVADSSSPEARGFYAWRYACFAAKVLGDVDKASDIMISAISQDKGNLVLYLQLLDIELSRVPPSEERGERVFQLAREEGDLSEEGKQSMAFRQIQFLEEYSSDIGKVIKAKEDYHKKYKKSGSRKRQAIESDNSTDLTKKSRQETDITSTASAQTLAGNSNATTAAATMATTTQSDPSTQWAAYGQQWGAYNYGSVYNYQQQTWPGYHYHQFGTQAHQ